MTILVVDDDRSLREACASFFQAHGHDVTTLGRGSEALEVVKRRHFDVVMLDLQMTQVSGMEILRAIRATGRNGLVVMMTGNPCVETNLEALRIGAWDYILKPFSPTHLEMMLGRAAHTIAALRESAGVTASEIRHDGNGQRFACVGTATSFLRAVELARRVAPTNASVMLSGESGTGKEVLAQLIHGLSRRTDHQLVPINCAAMPEHLLESEMFGHRRGAFTGADRDKPGLLEIANGGTLFLDELTEMSHRLQAKLLRVLQDGVVRRVGAETQQTVDVRFISATNRDPQEAVASGVLREDLFYRLRVVPIKLPPLRERVQDIPLLANHFLAMYWSRHRGGVGLPRFDETTMDDLMSRPWRGNVRELQNVIEHIAVLAEPNEPIRAEDIPSYEAAAENGLDSELPVALYDEGYHAAREKLMKRFERAYVSRVVERAGGNLSKAARLADIDRTTLYRLLERNSPR